MTREEYKKMRVDGIYNIKLFYDVYKEKWDGKGEAMPFDEFTQKFSLWLSMRGQRPESHIEKIVEFMDSKYNIVELRDRKNNVLNIF